MFSEGRGANLRRARTCRTFGLKERLFEEWCGANLTPSPAMTVLTDIGGGSVE